MIEKSIDIGERSGYICSMMSDNKNNKEVGAIWLTEAERI
jgi:hypothetical protein